jgi:hypothetical protein
MADKLALGEIFSEYEYFGLTSQFWSHRLFHIRHHVIRIWYIGQLVADVQGGLSLTPAQETKIKLWFLRYKGLFLFPHYIISYVYIYITYSWDC